MNLFICIVLFALGILLIVKGGDYLIDAASWTAALSGVPALMIGATLISLITTLPELLVSVLAMAQGEVEIAVGNAIGSVNANTGVILAVAVVFMPVALQRRAFSSRALLLVAASAALFAFSLWGGLGIWSSILLLLLFVLFLALETTQAHRSLHTGVDATAQIGVQSTRRQAVVHTLKFFGGVVGIVGGALLLVRYGSRLAMSLGLSKSLVGATFIAIGTSLPELVTTVIAISKKRAALSIGNLIGANIIDLTLILPLCTLFGGGRMRLPAQTAFLDLPVCLGLTVLSVLIPMCTKKYHRWLGAVLLAVYITYLTVMALFFGRAPAAASF